MAAARVYHGGRVPRWPSMALWSAVSLLPDADVIGFRLGVHYADPWGHRGATHSLAAAVALGLTIGLAARRFKRPVRRTALLAILVLASHGLLDTMTDGGLGCALLWPFDLTRYFAPWRPIPVAPIGLAFFSPGGAIIALTELVLFSPLFLFALWPRRLDKTPRAAARRRSGQAAVFLVLWLMSVWLISSGDPVRDAIVGFVVREDTAYTGGFSEKAFRTITPGQSDREVRDLLGPPFGESWFYPPRGEPFERAAATSASSLDECRAVRSEGAVVVTALDLDACRKAGIAAGTPLIDVKRLLGSPPESCWPYTSSPRGARYRIRVVCFLNPRVETVMRGWNW
jgi:inner membrane protein